MDSTLKFIQKPSSGLSVHDKTLWRFTIVFAMAVLLLGSGCGNDKERKSADELKNKVVVRVGEHSITLGEFQIAMKRLMPHGEEGTTQTELSELKKSLINQLIEEELIIQEAKARSLTVSEAELSGELKAIKDSYESEEFTAAILERYGDNEKWKEEIRRKLLVKKVVQDIVNSVVKTTAKEALAYYEENKPSYEIPEQVHARMIVVDTMQAAEDALLRLKSEPFELVAKAVSTGPEAAEGGDLGFFAKGEMPLEFEEAVFELKPGQTSPIVTTPYGFHVFKVLKKSKEHNLKFSDVKDKIIRQLDRERADENFRELMTTLKKNTRIEINKELL